MVQRPTVFAIVGLVVILSFGMLAGVSAGLVDTGNLDAANFVNQPDQKGISFVAFCFPSEQPDESIVNITSVTENSEGEVIAIEYTVTSGPSPEEVVHKAGTPIYSQPGNTSDTVSSGTGTDVTADRSPSSPCAEGLTALKFEADQGELSVGTEKTFSP